MPGPELLGDLNLKCYYFLGRKLHSSADIFPHRPGLAENGTEVPNFSKNRHPEGLRSALALEALQSFQQSTGHGRAL